LHITSQMTSKNDSKMSLRQAPRLVLAGKMQSKSLTRD
jgi:hypothetical protein